jgi:hypothetical protein
LAGHGGLADSLRCAQRAVRALHISKMIGPKLFVAGMVPHQGRGLHSGSSVLFQFGCIFA